MPPLPLNPPMENKFFVKESQTLHHTPSQKKRNYLKEDNFVDFIPDEGVLVKNKLQKYESYFSNP